MLSPSGFARYQSSNSPPSSPPSISTLIQTFKTVKDQAQKYNISTPLLALVAVARFLYQRRQASLEQLRLDQLHIRQLTVGSDTEEENEDEEGESSSHRPFVSPIAEWNIVAEDGTQTLSLVYYPVEEVDDEVVKNPQAEETLVLLIPGNPGNPYFYLPLMQELVKKHGRHHEVRCLSHTGHAMPWRHHNRDFTLQEQLDQKAFYVKQRLRENPNLRLVVIGHSIGSYILLDIARQFPQQIAKLVLLQPAIMHVALSRKGRQMMPLINNYELVVMFVGMLESIIPVSLRRWIIRRAVGSKTSDTIQLALLSLVNSSVLQNVFGMAASEVSDIGELDSELVSKHAEKMLFVYSAVDDWVPGEFMQEYQLRFPAARHRIVPHGHAFMMEPDGTRNTVVHISQWIGSILHTA